MCHNPSNTDATMRMNATNPADKALPPQGINFNMLVHRIHFGPNATADGAKNPYIVVGFGGSHNDFSTTRYPALSPTGSPGDTRNCSICHTSSSEANLPIGLNPVIDPQGWINPESAGFGRLQRLPHIQSRKRLTCWRNTTALGESCTVCHSTGSALCGGSGSRAVLERDSMNRLAAALIVLSLRAVYVGAEDTRPRAEAKTFIGSEMCGVCHEDIGKAFLKSPHEAIEKGDRHGFHRQGAVNRATDPEASMPKLSLRPTSAIRQRSPPPRPTGSV